MERARMRHEAHRKFVPLIGASRRLPAPTLFAVINEDEAAYCRFRADEEFARADEATHPAARAAHLAMAARYRERALAAR